MTDESASKFGEQAEKLTEKVECLTGKANKSKFGKVIRFASGIIKSVPGAEKIFSMSPSEFIPIENSIGEKKVILVFDDLERSNLNEVDVLGCINEYCENKLIKTIIVANEEKILNNVENKSVDDKVDSTDLPTKIKYSEIKEKIVTRTIKNIPDYENIIRQVVMEFQSNKTIYKEFLEEHVLDIINVFNCGESENIRSIKCAIQDFQRLFIELKNNGIDELLEYFNTFIAFTLMLKDEKIKKSEQYGYLFCDPALEKEYPGFYIKRYMFPSIKDWLIEGVWDDKNISEDICKILKTKKAEKPVDLVRYMDLIYLDEDVINAGLPDLIEMAYDGQLSIDEYIAIFRKLLWAKDISYNLPVEIDMEKLQEGVRICLDELSKSENLDSRVRSTIHPDSIDLMSGKEKEIYQEICLFRDNEVQMFAINKRKYLLALESGEINQLHECENKRFNIFDIDLAEANIDCYKSLKNADRTSFIDIFKNMWDSRSNSQELFKAESLDGFQKLQEMLLSNRDEESKNKYGIKAALSQIFIQDLTKIIETIKSNTKDEV